jgi:hypothetical protein
MRAILFIARVALICNIVSLFTIFLLFQNKIENNVALSTAIVIGYVLAMIFNPVTNLIALFLLIFKRDIFRRLPLWLVIVNFIFLLLQLQYIDHLNGTLDH